MICVCPLHTVISWTPYLGLIKEETQLPPKDNAFISYSQEGGESLLYRYLLKQEVCFLQTPALPTKWEAPPEHYLEELNSWLHPFRQQLRRRVHPQVSLWIQALWVHLLVFLMIASHRSLILEIFPSRCFNLHVPEDVTSATWHV